MGFSELWTPPFYPIENSDSSSISCIPLCFQSLKKHLTKKWGDASSLLVVGQPKAWLGSLATRMVKNASCDVYIVRANE